MRLWNVIDASFPTRSATPLRRASLSSAESKAAWRSSTRSGWTLPRSSRRTGHVFDQSHSGSMKSPLKRSRRPSKRACRTDTVSDLPKRLGRAMKNCRPTDLLTSGQSRSVLSTYVKPSWIRLANV